MTQHTHKRARLLRARKYLAGVCRDILLLAGLALICCGLGKISSALALIVAGLIVMAFALSPYKKRRVE